MGTDYVKEVLEGFRIYAYRGGLSRSTGTDSVKGVFEGRPHIAEG